MIDDRVLAAMYHAQHSLQMEDLPFWQQLAENQGGPILELGCGTGRLLIPLAGAGFQIFGIDQSAAMLSVLAAHLPEEAQPHAFLIRADLVAMRLALRFPLIILPCNTLSTLSLRERGLAFSRVRGHLCPDGLFVASVPNPALLASFPDYGEPALEEVITHPFSGNPVQVSSSWNRTPEEFTVTWNYDHLLPDGSVERLATSSRHFLADQDQYFAELKRRGLQLEAVVGDYNNSPVSPTSPYLILLATKAGNYER